MCLMRALRFALGIVFVFASANIGHADTGLPLRGKKGEKPNVLLLTIDTLRMDHLGVYGYDLPTSPSIDRLAAEGVLFTDAITPVPMTAPALAAMLTGQHVNKHHVTENAGTFSAQVTSVAEAFRDAGYETAGFYGNEAVEEFGRGFGTFHKFPVRKAEQGRMAADERGVEKGIEWLKGAKEPWFLWLHFIDPHGAYDSSPPSRSAAFEYEDSPELDKKLEHSTKNWVYGAIPRYQHLPDTYRVGDYVRRYDGEIVGTDLQIGRLRDWLEKKGELEETLIVLTADHGESLGEDNYYFQHGKRLNESSLRIPFLLRHGALPSGKKVDAPISLIDVYPTIAALVGLPPPRDVDGQDVSGAVFGQSLGDRLRVTYTVTPDLQVGIFRGQRRLHGRPRKNEDGSVQVDDFPLVFLTDTTSYPETRLKPRDHRKELRDMKAELVDASRKIRDFTAPSVDLTEKQTDRLRALGYIE